jgi:hypothetical protein
MEDLMSPAQSPFPLGWWGTALDNVGLETQRPLVGTYGRYEFANLPQLPVQLDGNFGWLAGAPSYDHSEGSEDALSNSIKITELIDACKAVGVPLPMPFLKFAQSLDLQARIRSNTGCFFDFADRPVRSPGQEGHLVRFLADSQGCIFWYLYMPNSGHEYAVVASPLFFDTDEGELQDLELDPQAIVFCAESFEAFVCRFWIENELWFSEVDGTPPSNLGQQYFERYRQSPPDPLVRDVRVSLFAKPQATK